MAATDLDIEDSAPWVWERFVNGATTRYSLSLEMCLRCPWDGSRNLAQERCTVWVDGVPEEHRSDRCRWC